MSFTVNVPRPRHLPSAPGMPSASRFTIGWTTTMRSVWDSLRWWWLTGSWRQPEPGLLHAGQDTTPPEPILSPSYRRARD
jgi:hypothetical protein